MGMDTISIKYKSYSMVLDKGENKMITVRVDKNRKPIEVIDNKQRNDLVIMPNLESIMDKVNDNSCLECEYGDLIEDDMLTIKELLNSKKECLVELGRVLLGYIVDDYNGAVGNDEELTMDAAELIEFILTKSDTDTIL